MSQRMRALFCGTTLTCLAFSVAFFAIGGEPDCPQKAAALNGGDINAIAATTPSQPGEDDRPTPRPENKDIKVLEQPADPEFDQRVDLGLAREAWLQRDAAALANIALKLAEAELALKRNHKTVTSKTLIEQAVRLAGETRDLPVLARLRKAAESRGDKQLVEEVSTMEKFAAAARSTDKKLPIPANAPADLVGQLKEYQDALETLRQRGDWTLTGLDALEQETASNSKLNATQKAYFKNAIAEIRTNPPELSLDTTNMLASLSGSSRAAGSRVTKDIYIKKEPLFCSQAQSNWCWAAVTETVCFINGFGSKSQSMMAARFNAIKPGTNVCEGASGKTKECNQGNNLGKVLNHYGALAKHHDFAFQSSSKLEEEIKNNRPVCIRIGWQKEGKETGGHVIILYGLRYTEVPSQKNLSYMEYRIWDPLPVNKGTLLILRDTQLAQYYKSRGKWTDTYFTKRKS